jgi:hypothetical protein
MMVILSRGHPPHQQMHRLLDIEEEEEEDGGDSTGNDVNFDDYGMEDY